MPLFQLHNWCHGIHGKFLVFHGFLQLVFHFHGYSGCWIIYSFYLFFRYRDGKKKVWRCTWLKGDAHVGCLSGMSLSPTTISSLYFLFYSSETFLFFPLSIFILPLILFFDTFTHRFNDNILKINIICKSILTVRMFAGTWIAFWNLLEQRWRQDTHGWIQRVGFIFLLMKKPRYRVT